jgi:hypothetical protein
MITNQPLYHLTKRAIGGGNKDRTCDIQLAKLALSQLSYTPNEAIIYGFLLIVKTFANQLLDSEAKTSVLFHSLF